MVNPETIVPLSYGVQYMLKNGGPWHYLHTRINTNLLYTLRYLIENTQIGILSFTSNNHERIPTRIRDYRLSQKAKEWIDGGCDDDVDNRPE